MKKIRTSLLTAKFVYDEPDTMGDGKTSTNSISLPTFNFLPSESKQAAFTPQRSKNASRSASPKPQLSPISNFTVASKEKDDIVEYVIVDVFTREKLKGNALAVVFEESAARPLSVAEKQSIAKEFNLSETVFIGDGSILEIEDVLHREWPLTIMTPFEELPFAGHPVVGAACALSFERNMVTGGSFATKAGNIDFSVERSVFSKTHALARAEVSVPYKVHLHKTRLSLADLGQKGLVSHDVINDGKFPIFSITKGMSYILVEVKSMAALAQVATSGQKPKYELDRNWKPSFVGIYYYYRAPSFYESDPVELHTRMMEPDIGEDAVTGSAACTLAAYLSLESAKRVEIQRSFDFHITQGEHMGRKGTPVVQVKLDDEKKISSMILKGDAVRVMRGTIER